LHFLGGVEWSGALFYVLIVGDASVVLPTRSTYLVATFGRPALQRLGLSEYSGLVPHRPFFLPGLALHQDLTWVTLTVLSALGALFYLAHAGSRLAAAARQRKEALRIAYAQQARELEAGSLRSGQVSQSAPAIPGLDIAAVNLPAAEVSGDFYDFLPAGDGRHCSSSVTWLAMGFHRRSRWQQP